MGETVEQIHFGKTLLRGSSVDSKLEKISVLHELRKLSGNKN